MNATHWRRLQEIVSAAASLPVSERTQYLRHCCDDDEELRREADGLLAAYSQSGDLFENAIGGAAARVARGTDLDPGDTIGPYQITGTIGHGGMGTVYSAQRSDRQFRQSVAIKLVRTGPGTNQELFARFRAERQILANINHANIARLLDGGITESGLPYLVMEYVEGLTLDRYVAAHNPSVPDRLALFRQICAAIQHAHQNLVVHRDLKPGNIMVSADGVPKLLDFGIAKLLSPEAVGTDTAIYTRPAERLMTPEYASPEQIRGETITTATDIYGLGVLLYELLTGSRPFQISSLSYTEVERLICETPPRPPSSVGSQTVKFTTRKQTDLDRIVLKALHKTPARRYASASDLSADIERYLEGFPVTARPDSFGYRTRRFVARNWLAVGAVVLFLATVIGLSIKVEINANRASREAASAEAVSQYLVGLMNITGPDSIQGRNVSARELLDRGTERLETSWNGKPVIKARLLNTMGQIYYQLGALDRAESLVTEAQQILAGQADEALAYAETANTLGAIAQDKGDFERSSQQFNQARAIYEKKKGHNSTDVANVVNNLGALRWAEGDYKGAVAYHREAIAIDTKLFGPEAEPTLLEKGDLEAVLANEGDYRAAEPLVREVLAEHIRLFGNYNSHTATEMNNLAYIYNRTGRMQQAGALLQQTLDIRHKLYGAEHPEISMSLVFLGTIQREMGHFDLAKNLTEQGLAMETRLQGPESLDVTFDQDALGLIYIEAGDPAAARPWVEKALATRLAKRRPSQSLLSQSYDHLGLIDLEEGKPAEALSQFRQSLQIRQQFYQWENDSVAMSYNHLGRALMANGDLAEAEKAYDTALRIARQNFGDAAHPITAEALYGLGELALARHKLQEASSDLIQSLQMRQALYPAGHPDLLATERAIKAVNKERAPSQGFSQPVKPIPFKEQSFLQPV